MNLHKLVNKLVGKVNPMIDIVVQRSTGYTTAGDGKRVPSYEAITLKAQVQQLTSAEISQLNGINIQSQVQGMYIDGMLNGASRPDGTGGDLVTFPDGSVWLVVQVLENWGDVNGWAKVALIQQNRA